MKSLWPSAFFLLGLLPLLVVIYVRFQRRRRRYAVRYSSLALIREALPAQSCLRRYLPPALFLLALASLVVGLARPVVTTLVPAGRATVMLVMDVSSSMLQYDITPSRLAAAKEAALSFVERQRTNNQVGIVAFAGIAQLVQYPSTDPEELELAIQGLTTGRGTAMGSGMLVALDAIDEYNLALAASTGGASTEAQAAAVEGDYAADIVVVLTDGVYNAGADPLEAAQVAADRGIRVYTIGYGTSSGAAEGGGFAPGGNRGIDEASLQEIAALTGGEYYSASSANELNKVLSDLPTYLITREETVEISVLFVAIGALLGVAAVMLSQLWHPLA